VTTTTESPLASGLLLSDGQFSSVAESTARINIWDGSVRSGKTVASLLRWLMYVATAPKGGDLVVVGKTYDTVSRNVFGPLEQFSLFGPASKLCSYVRGSSYGRILNRKVEVITANDARAEGRLRGLTAAGAYVDEATLIPQEFWNQLLARLSVKGAKLFATTNPDSPGHWLRKNFLLKEDELSLAHFHFKIEDNIALDPEYVSELKKEYVGLWYKRFIEGLWVQAEGAVYDMWDPDRHVIDIMPKIMRWISLGIDYGTKNPFAGQMIGVGVDRKMYMTNEFRWDSKAARRSLTDVEYSVKLREWMDQIKQPGLADVTGVRPEWTVVDPSASSFIQQLFRDGVVPIMANNSVADGIRVLSSLLGQDLLKIHRSCTGWIEEIGGYAWDDKASEKGLDQPIKVDDHHMDAGRYGIFTTEASWRPLLAQQKAKAA
jgi:PBSX family phage terminase large subunit